MQSIPTWLDAIAVRQDYLWFLLAAGWVILMVLHRRTPPPGLQALGFAVVAIAVSEVASMLLLRDSVGVPNLPAENLGRTFACLPGVAWLGAMQAAAGRRPLALGSALGLAGLQIAVIWGRPFGPVGSLALGTVLALGTGLLAGWWCLRPRAGTTLLPGAGWLCLLVGTSPLFASSGALAELLGWPRRWLTASPVGVVSVIWHAILLAQAWRLWRVPATEEEGLKSEAIAQRQPLVLLAIWFALGGLLVEASGRKAFDEYLGSLQMRNRTCLLTLDRERLAACLGPFFQLERVRLMPNPAWQAYYADAPAVLSDEFLPLQRHLGRLGQESPDLTWLLITTLRGPWLVTAVLPNTGEVRRGTVSVQREATPGDRLAWAARSGYVAGPAWSPRGTFLEVAEPVLAPDGRMLGWLTMKIDSYRVLAAQAPARLLTGLTVALGAVVGTGAHVLRRRGQAQRTAAAQAAAARAADRMKSALLANVSHELRTPLQGILGYAELLARQPLNEEQRRWLQAQQRQSRLLLRLVNDLIDLGALQSGMFTLALRPGQLAGLVEETVLLLRPRAHLRQLNLECEVEPGVPDWMDFDADRVRQVVMNLVGNAIKFTERGGIAVRLGVKARHGEVVLVELAVADTGPGIDPAQQPRLFQPFVRLDTGRTTEGAGLGLAMTAGLCRAMGGGLTLQSDGKSGSTFRALLEMRIVPAAVEGNLPCEAGGFRGLRIIVADDNALVRELYGTHLATLGATCVSAANGREAVDAARAEPRPDLLLLDLSMPYLDGLAVARELRSRGPAGLCIIGISAHGNPDYQRQALEAGMNDFLVKPVTLEQLGHCVQKHLQGRGAAPGLDAALPSGLQARLQDTFHRETPGQLQQIAEALRRQDWPVVQARAHYLKNSAWVLGMHALADCCQALYLSAQAGDAAAAAEHFLAIQRLLSGRDE